MQRGHLVDLATELVKLVGALSPVPPVDDEGLRQRCLDLLAEFQARAARAGYGQDQVDAARYALVALIDERVMSLDAPIRDAWSAAPLQIRLFEAFNAGEAFFERLAAFRNPNSPDRADVLEVFHLCLCLGFKGRYGDPSLADARNQLIAQIANDVRAARSGLNAALSPGWEPRGASVQGPHPGRWLGMPLWVVPLGVAAVVLLAWLGAALWTSSAVDGFLRDFPVR